MKLISCYIENFGKYQNASFDFSRGLTTYHLDNGEGKTTLATFLRVMLYGMNTDRKETYGVRSQYNPFQGGNYGGWLMLEKGGKIYKITRFFDKKSAVKDILTVTDERERECDDLGKIPGETLFGLNEEAFMRTSYITWEKTQIDLQHGIGERLCGLVSDDSSVPLDKALKALSEHEKTYHSGRKSGGVYTGKIPEMEDLIAETNAEIYAIENAEKELAAVRERYAKAYAEERALSVEIEKMGEAGTRRTRWEHYRSLLSAAEEETLKKQSLQLQYPQGFPTAEEMQGLKSDLRSARDMETVLKTREFPKEAELAKREAQFANGVPTPERLERAENLVDQYLSTLYEPAQVQSSVQKSAPVKKKGGAIAVAFLGVLLPVLGFLFLSKQPIVTALLCVVGVIFLSIGGYLAKRQKQAGEELYAPPAQNVQNTELKVRLEDFFWQYGVRVADFAAAIRILKEDISTLHSLRKEKDVYNQTTDRLQQTAAESRARARATLNRYALSEESWENALHDAQAYAEAVRLEALKGQRAEEYRIQYALTEEPQTQGGFEEMKERFALLQEETRELRVQKQLLESKVARLPQFKAKLDSQRQLLETYRREKVLVETATACLVEADRSLKDTYLKPMQDSFLAFAKQMGAEWADTVKLGDRLEISFAERGLLRREEHLSDGQRSLAALCMRLALMENIHKGETPFCILDDPFVHLDERHLEEVKNGVRSLAEKMQIVYFTCHSSRMI